MDERIESEKRRRESREPLEQSGAMERREEERKVREKGREE